MSLENEVTASLVKSDRDRQDYYIQYRLEKPKPKVKKIKRTPIAMVNSNNDLVLPKSDTPKKDK